VIPEKDNLRHGPRNYHLEREWMNLRNWRPLHTALTEQKKVSQFVVDVKVVALVAV
jgi:hypothetical protein